MAIVYITSIFVFQGFFLCSYFSIGLALKLGVVHLFFWCAGSEWLHSLPAELLGGQGLDTFGCLGMAWVEGTWNMVHERVVASHGEGRWLNLNVGPYIYQYNSTQFLRYVCSMVRFSSAPYMWIFPCIFGCLVLNPPKRQVSLKALTIDSALKWEQIQKNIVKQMLYRDITP